MGSRTFFAASFLLPRRVSGPASAVYALCREADDAIDCQGGRAEVLVALRERLDRIYAGRPGPSAVDRAFADVVERFGLPRALPEALLEGLGWDAACRRYETLPELRAYAARVAGAVGAMMAVLMGARAPGILARACELGVAMQLTNIARDVGEDARTGRVYLPLAWLREAGIDPDRWLETPRWTVALGSVVARLLDEAEALYARAAAGVPHLPLDCRPGIHAARLLYAAIGSEIRRTGLDSVTQRAVLPRRRKLLGCAQALLALPLSATALTEPPLAETRYLVEAATGLPLLQSDASAAGGRRSLDDRAAWLFDLFERLERRELVSHGSHPA